MLNYYLVINSTPTTVQVKTKYEMNLKNNFTKISIGRKFTYDKSLELNSKRFQLHSENFK